MAKRPASKTPRPETVSLSIEIEDHLTHYSFSEGWPRDGPGAALSERVSVYLWGPIVSPAEKSGRVVLATVSGSEHVLARERDSDGTAPAFGELFWGKNRVAHIYLPERSMWPLAHEIGAGRLKRLHLTVDAPLRGNVPVRSLHILTRELDVLFGGDAESK